jgi:hypothetical protein
LQTALSRRPTGGILLELHLDLAHPALTGEASPKVIATSASDFCSTRRKKMNDTDRTKFSLGRIVATPGALAALEVASESSHGYLKRHAAGDWGEIPPEDWEENEFSLGKRLRLLSVYHLGDGTKIWVITEADRSVTTILLPSEY